MDILFGPFYFFVSFENEFVFIVVFFKDYWGQVHVTAWYLLSAQVGPVQPAAQIHM